MPYAMKPLLPSGTIIDQHPENLGHRFLFKIFVLKKPEYSI